MQELYVRAVIALLTAAVLMTYARRAPLQSRRRQAMLAGVVGALLIGTANLLQALLTGSVLVPALFVAGGLTMVAGVALLYLGYRQGEFAEQIARARAATAEERRRRSERDTEQKQR